VTRAQANLQIMNKLDLVGETSEFARIFGIQFFHAIFRGSQVTTAAKVTNTTTTTTLFVHTFKVKKKGQRLSAAFNGTQSQRYGASPAI